MKQLKIGQPVRVYAITTFEYDEQDKRVQCTHKCEPFSAVIIGIRIKQIGRYCRGSKGYSFGGIYEYDPPYFAVSGIVRLWECRHGMENKPILVADEDLEVMKRFKVPRRATLPWRKNV